MRGALPVVLSLLLLVTAQAAGSWQGGGAPAYKKWRRSTQPVVLHFWAPWCGVCRKMRPEMEALMDTYGGEIGILPLNVDDPAVEAIARTHGVSGIPHTEVFQDSHTLLYRWVGFVSRHRLYEAVAPLLPPAEEDEEEENTDPQEISAP